MSCIVWNYRGLENQLAVQELAEVVTAKAPTVVFLAKTLADEARLDFVKDRIRFDKKFVVLRVNRGGGLVLYWKNDLLIDVVSSSLNHIDVIINKDTKAAWRFTGLKTHKRQESWELLRNLHSQNSLPWLCAGDFNEILKQSEKLGGRTRPPGQIQLFRDTLDECGLMDIGFKGSPFTWSKHCNNRISIWERLDRAVVSYQWFSKHPGTQVHHIDSTTSDHKILRIEQSVLDCSPRKKLFRFEEMWLGDKGCGETVEGVWQINYEEEGNTRVIRKVEKCGTALTNWSKDSFGNVVTAEMNDSLTENFQPWEVELALKQMAPLKAPGPDGMLPLFYQNFWDLVRGDVIHDVLGFLNSGSLPNSLNHTFITLIPKIKNPEFVTQYRPISLCNVLYKIFSKVLANRLKRVLPNISSEHQSAFLKGRLITDNILVAFETLHYMKNHNSGSSGYTVLKLDMSKAYDRMEWSFLKVVMSQMGFNDWWIDLVMECITSVTYSILINGEPNGDIRPSRGIRQGDPLSLYLFLLCSERLHRLIQQAIEKGDIQGVSICRNGPKLTHLFFADDSLLFCRATTQECEKVMDILSSYEKVSGKKLNRDKTALFFSKSTPTETQRQIMETLGVNELKQYEDYLGLPALVGRNKRASFDQLKQRIWKRLQGWEGKLLSQAGREETSNVEALINPVTKRWRTEIIDHVFNEQEAETIKNIPLCSTNQTDVLVWPFTPSGNYSVKSGYRFLSENSTQPQRTEKDSGLWKKIWSLEVMWNADPQWRWLSEMTGRSVKDIFTRAFEEEMDVALMAFTSWAVWNRRNQVRLNETACPLEQIHALSKDKKNEFQLLH
ncbi:uncharacterized protein LOC115956706 [Quercus lobata]|uniref:uncharacterized protein LOC115956706 n=1 Tax=Quercus lobata TaxID=97700 RepID=UPI0012482FBB|nr:uncharacterized protein LOC115956706 [Quercus lobata]